MKIHRSRLLSLSFTILACSFFSNAVVANESDVEKASELVVENCHIDGIKEQVKCGTLQVPENYTLPDGDKISINFAILPAIDNSENKTPLMFLAGGPGQAAVELAAGLRRVFLEVRKTHDIILIDQRGTGKSHALECPDIEQQNVYAVLPEDFSTQEVKDCIAQFSGDLSQYNSENSIRDFDAVRAALGHKQVHIYGGSYGTRAGLVYMRMFPDSIKSAVLDSVGPIEVPIGLFGKSSARSFQLLLKHCQEEQTCNDAYPNLAQEFNDVITRLEQNTVTLNIPHPRLGTSTVFSISKGKFLGHLFMQLYSLQGRSLVPLVIHQAYLGNYAPLAGLTAATENGMGIYTGLLFNIVCNEDFPRMTTEMLAKDANNDFGGSNSQEGFVKACSVWPKYRPSTEFYTREPSEKTANIPTLILSGGLDPVTPPSNGEYPEKSQKNSRHIIVDNVSHGVATSTCAVDIINEFITTLNPNSLDESCLDDVPAESFMTSLNGGN